ncbi:hypothetical protein ACONDI_01971 [Natranaerofaba carboxydovora]|nr:hypothetical protein ACONDI_01971 [Natranaerofaba carboxydovora]
MLTLIKAIILIIGLIILFFLVIPVNYRFVGGYKDYLWFSFKVNSLIVLGIKGNWTNEMDKPFQTHIILFGLSIPFTRQRKEEKKEKKEEKKKKEKTGKKEKEQGKYNLSKIFSSLDSELIGNAIKLLKEIIYILKPDKCMLEGKLGFSEPHLNGYLTAIIYMIQENIRGIEVNIEPYWKEEHYDLHLTIKGKIVLSVLLFKLARFLLTKRSRQFIKDLKKAKRLDSKAV